MTHLELVAHVAGTTDVGEDEVRRVLDAAFEAIVEEVAKEEKVVIGGFGTFKAGLKRHGPRADKSAPRKKKITLTASSTMDGKLNG
jgi:nucleoid DNA-binding protein